MLGVSGVLKTYQCVRTVSYHFHQHDSLKFLILYLPFHAKHTTNQYGRNLTFQHLVHLSNPFKSISPWLGPGMLIRGI